MAREAEDRDRELDASVTLESTTVDGRVQQSPRDLLRTAFLTGDSTKIQFAIHTALFGEQSRDYWQWKPLQRAIRFYVGRASSFSSCEDRQNAGCLVSNVAWVMYAGDEREYQPSMWCWVRDVRDPDANSSMSYRHLVADSGMSVDELASLGFGPDGLVPP